MDDLFSGHKGRDDGADNAPSPRLARSAGTSRIAESLKSADPYLRRRAAVLLKKKPWARAVGALTGALQDADSAVRFCAASSLTAIFKRVEIPNGEWLSEKEDPGHKRWGRVMHRRFDMYELLARSLIPLALAMGDSEPSVVTAAARAIDALGFNIFEMMVSKDEPSQAADIAKCVGILVRRLADGSKPVRLAAAKLLFNFQAPSSIATLLGALRQEPSYDIRWWVSLALQHYTSLNRGGVATQTVLAVLVDVLGKDTEPGIRSKMATLLGDRYCRHKTIENPLLEATRDESDWVRSSAARSLGKIKCRRSADRLAALLEDASPLVRSEAARALGEIGARSMGGKLIPLLQDGDESVRRAAAGALGILKEQAAIPMLIQCLHKSGGAWAGRAAAEALACLRPREAVPTLIRTLGDPDEDTRIGSARALGNTRDKRAWEPLRRALENDDDPVVRVLAARGLFRIDRRSSVVCLKKALKREKEPYAEQEIRATLRWIQGKDVPRGE